MENIADRASVEIAAVCTCGRSIAFICSELRSKKKFSEIWETDRNILMPVMQCKHNQLGLQQQDLSQHKGGTCETYKENATL